ncbi:MAG TPA: hypothetical protein VF407_24725, partial [Polyangiaceae bacterium]
GLLKIAIDEETADQDGTGVTVRALHITALSGSAVDVTVAYAAADTGKGCGCEAPPPRDAGTDAGGSTKCYDNSDCAPGQVCIPDDYDTNSR